MTQSVPPMSADEVVRVVGWLERAGAVHQVNGGWGVDALAGRQTREHADLDVFVDEAVVVPLLAWLASRGYLPVVDWLPVRIELAGPTGRVDVHPMAIQPNGDGLQQGLDGQVFVHRARERTVGRVAGNAVVTASPARLRELRTGYALRAVDRHDLEVLDGLDGRSSPLSP